MPKFIIPVIDRRDGEFCSFTIEDIDARSATEIGRAMYSNQFTVGNAIESSEFAQRATDADLERPDLIHSESDAAATA